MNDLNFPLLLIEDSPEDALLIERTLRKLNYMMMLNIVKNGEEALDYLSGIGPYADRKVHPLPVLVLLDLRLPRINGFGVLTWIRQQPGLKRMFVVVLTGYRSQVEAQQAYDLGATAYIVKPLEPSAFTEVMRGLFSFVALAERPTVLDEKTVNWREGMPRSSSW
jgi:CheY-like chemotaxis protein